MHQTIKKVTSDIGVEQQFNTAIASLMELFNVFTSTELDNTADSCLIRFVIGNMTLLMAPIVPHFAEEIWEMLGNKESIFRAAWPLFDESLTVEDSIEFVIQVNGKIRDKMKMPLNAVQADIETAVFGSAALKPWIEGKEIVKKIFVRNKLFNLVVK
jgi:leucyl-tRNA synthetase